MAQNKSLKELQKQAKDIAADAELSDTDKCVQIAKSIPRQYGTYNQRRMMAVLILPGSESWSVTKMCKIAQVCTTEWYRVTKTEKFNNSLCKIQRQVKAIFLPAIFRAFVKKAIFGDKDGFGNSANQLAFLRDLEILKADVSSKGANLNLNVTIVQEGKQKIEENRLHAYKLLGYTDSDN